MSASEGSKRALAAALRAASSQFAKAMRDVSRVKTRKTAEAVNIVQRTNENLIRAGRPGRWGWDPIQASMFENDRRHPLFGDKSHWYHQGKYPITLLSEKAALNRATEAFADVFVPAIAREHGFDR